MELRPYQRECLEKIKEKGDGRWLIQMATGLGKGAILPFINYEGKTLFIQHRDELVEQNSEFFEDKTFEKGKSEAGDEKFVFSSIQTLLHRKEKFKSDQFHTIVIDEIHRYAASHWAEAVSYFNPKRILGFTATPNRADGKGLENLFDEIIFERDIEFGISNGYLTPLHCERIDVGYDISKIASRMGDLVQGELAKAVGIDSANQVIKEIFESHPKPTMIFCVNVEHAETLAKALGIKSISQKTKNRAEILQEFRDGQLEGICSINVLTEGVNLNNAKTLIMARPTQSELLYQQIVGRIVRLAPGKDVAHLIDCVGATGQHQLCGAHTLLGLDLETVPVAERVEIYGDLLQDLPDLIKKKSDDPRTFIKNRQIVNLFAKKNKLKLYGVNFIKHPDGSLIVGVGEKQWLGITKINHLRQAKVVSFSGKEYPLLPVQESIDLIIGILNTHCKENKTIWDFRAVARWGKQEATSKQKRFTRILLNEAGMGGFNIERLNRQELSIIIARLQWKKYG